MRLTEAYMALGIVEEAQTAAAVLGHNFPDSVWYKHAYTLVKTGGVEPYGEQGFLDQPGLREFQKVDPGLSAPLSWPAKAGHPGCAAILVNISIGGHYRIVRFRG